MKSTEFQKSRWKKNNWKKSSRRRIGAVLIAAAVALTPLSGLAAFADTFGNRLSEKSIQTTETTKLVNGVFYSTTLNDRLTENFVTYQPGGQVVPIVAYGNDIYGAAGFKTVVSYAEAQGQRVIAGINADYFTMANGVAVGLVIQEGIIKASESNSYTSIGFRRDGTAMIARSGLNIKVEAQCFPNGVGLVNLNKQVTDNSGLMMYTDAYNDSNKAAIPTVNALISVTEGEPRINQSMTGVVQSVNDAAEPTPIPDGMVLLTMSANSAYPATLAQFRELQVGDAVTFNFTADESWNDVYYAVGAGEKLVTNGVNVAPAKAERHPRTAVGIKEDGSLILYTVDGRQKGYSAGVTFQEEALRMLELGAVEAVNMDGGGSTSMLALYPGDSDVNTINKPSGGSLRSCANYILLVSQGQATGSLGGLHLYPYSQMLLAGAKQQLTVKATDTNYYPASVPGSLSFTTDSLGTIDDSGMYTAGSQSGKSRVEVSGDGASGSTDVTIVTDPSAIDIINGATGQSVGDAVSVSAGSAFTFSAAATYNSLPLVAQAQCFRWSVSGDIGTIDDQGVFTPGGTEKSGTLTASAGGRTDTVTVNIVSEGERIEDFESDDVKIAVGTMAGISASLEKDLAYVHNGKRSLKLAYQSQGAGVQSVLSTISFSRSPSMLTMWMYGDGSGNTVSLNVQTANGTADTEVQKLDFTGWKQLIFPLPAEAAGINSLNVNTEAASAGTLYVDQIMAGYGYYVDNQAPSITASVSGQTLSAIVEDAVDTKLSGDSIAVTYDGRIQAFNYDASTKKLTANLPASDGNAHRVSVKAGDASGNIQRASVTIPSTTTSAAFTDMGGHWADPYTSYLYSQNIISGRIQPDGSRMYFPSLNMNRAEFSSVMVQWLGLDTAQYSDIQLPFADAAAIPDWALPAVKAVYGSGLMSGRGSDDGKIYFTPAGPITRQEVMTVIGHTQERGYAEADLSKDFGDSAGVAAWAAPYVKTLVAQGVISGYDGNVWPALPVTRAQVASIIFNLN